MNVYQERLQRLQKAMQGKQVSGLLLSPGTSMRYLSGFAEPGFERLILLIVPTDGAPSFLVPSLNADQARNNPAGYLSITGWDDGQGWQETFARLTRGPQFQRGNIAVDGSMPTRFSLPLAELLPCALFVLADELLSSLRAQKDVHELELMQQAARATDALLPAIYETCGSGVSERDIANLVQKQITEQGHQPSFEPIVATGANGARPHHAPGATPLSGGDVIVIDFGVRVGGYCGDITRTVALGRASDEAKRVYDIVYRAYLAGVVAVQPGATGHDVDAAARRVISDAGYGEYFIHRTGHGIGLDDHEPPFMVAGNHDPLQPGACFSIEPGIYLPDNFGVRLENIVTVQDDGTARVMNEAIPPELLII